MEPSEITRLTMEAWDEIVAEEAGVEPESPGEEPDEPDESDDEEDEDAGGDEPVEDEDETEDEEEGEPEQEPESAGYETDDIEVRAFLAKYGGDLDAALKGASELYHLMGRQGMEKTQLEEQLVAAREEAERLRLTQNGIVPLTEEQQQWIGQAVESGQPAFFVQQAVDAGEWELAKALCAVWGQDDPYNARRIADQVEAVEYQVKNPPQPPVDLGILLKTMGERDPSILQYRDAATAVVERLGPEHRLVKEALSGDLGTTIQAIQTIYEIAKASNVSITEARSKVREQQAKEAEEAKQAGLVSSGAATPSNGGTPRSSRRIGPGLTLEQLEAAFAEQ